MEDLRADGLTGVLMMIAAQPGRVAEFYEILGEFCHTYRNRLNSLKLGLYLAKSAETRGAARWAPAEAAYAALERRIDAIQRLCRPIRPAPDRYDLASLLDDRRDRWENWGLRLDWCAPKRPAIGEFDPSLLGEALDEWARGRASRSRPSDEIRLAWSHSRGRFRLDWEERGEGAVLDPEDLSLPVLARVISVHGGSISLKAEGGLRLSMGWPSGVGSHDGRRNGRSSKGAGGPTLTAPRPRA